MLEEVVVIVWEKDQLDSFWTLRNPQKLWKTVLSTSKSILISEGSINGI